MHALRLLDSSFRSTRRCLGQLGRALVLYHPGFGRVVRGYGCVYRGSGRRQRARGRLEGRGGRLFPVCGDEFPGAFRVQGGFGDNFSGHDATGKPPGALGRPPKAIRRIPETTSPGEVVSSSGVFATWRGVDVTGTRVIGRCAQVLLPTSWASASLSSVGMGTP